MSEPSLSPTRVLVILALLAVTSCAPTRYRDLRGAHDASLQAAFDEAVNAAPNAQAFWEGVRNKQASVVVADVTDPRRPRVAGYNPDLMLYAASVPKVAIVFGAMVEVQEGTLALDGHRGFKLGIRTMSEYGSYGKPLRGPAAGRFQGARLVAERCDGLSGMAWVFLACPEQAPGRAGPRGPGACGGGSAGRDSSCDAWGATGYGS